MVFLFLKSVELSSDAFYCTDVIYSSFSLRFNHYAFWCERNKLILDGLRVSEFSANFHFRVKSSFACFVLCTDGAVLSI